jgi:YesN/AraC family two-component response regulator
MAVQAALDKLSIPYQSVELGVAELKDNISQDELKKLDSELRISGLEVIEDKKKILVEKIKNIIIEWTHYSEELPKVTFSVYLSSKLNYNYTYLSKIFAEVMETTIENYIITCKIERVKELLNYDELNLTEISFMTHYSSVAHLSNQFKRKTGYAPSQFKQLKEKNRYALEEVGAAV